MSDKIIYNADTMKLMALFESLTRSKLKDCFETNETLVFIVEPGQMGLAIGKKGANIKTLDNLLKRRFRIIEFAENIERFVQNIIYPQQVTNVQIEGDTVILTPVDTQARGYIIGRAGSNLRFAESIAKRFYNTVKEIKVI